MQFVSLNALCGMDCPTAVAVTPNLWHTTDWALAKRLSCDHCSYGSPRAEFLCERSRTDGLAGIAPTRFGTDARIAFDTKDHIATVVERLNRNPRSAASGSRSESCGQLPAEMKRLGLEG